jgi:hypothetical protein
MTNLYAIRLPTWMLTFGFICPETMGAGRPAGGHFKTSGLSIFFDEMTPEVPGLIIQKSY